MRGPPSSGPAAADAGSGVEEHQGSRKSEGTIDKGHDKKSAKDDKKSPKHKKEHKQKSEKKERKDRSHKKKRKRKDRKRRSRSDSSASTTGSDSNSDNNKTEGYKRPRVPEFNPLLQTLALSLSDTTRAFVVN
jgi:outer membrane biosynthesis protein TonB